MSWLWGYEQTIEGQVKGMHTEQGGEQNQGSLTGPREYADV